MCGIIGYVGKRQAQSILIEGLHRLEYRGYDSAGIAIVGPKKITITKCKGRIKDLQESVKQRNLTGSVGLGHTRWATHGKPSQKNAHPHFSQSKTFIVVHNGIIENFGSLRDTLKQKGYTFRSETDTEVIAHLLEYHYHGDVLAAVKAVMKQVHGSFALGIICQQEPGKIIAVRRDSPLIIGVGKNENFIASDVSAVLDHTRRVVYMQDDQIAIISADTIAFYDKHGKKVPIVTKKVSFSVEEVQKGGFHHFMQKEIFEQPKVLGKILQQYVTSKTKIEFAGLKKGLFTDIKKVVIVACGTAYHAGMTGKYLIESFARIPVWVDLGSEFRYRNPIVNKKTLVIAISQSGETADTLAAVRQVKKQGIKVLAICNVLGSTLTREADYTIYTHAGPEISVASTKAFTAQLMVVYLLSLYIGKIKKALSFKAFQQAIATLRHVPAKQQYILSSALKIKAIAKKHLHFGAFLYLGRNVNYPIALEGALKLKEISYIPAEGYAAGEMKHGPIALIDEYRAVVCIGTDSFVFEKMVSNILEILARKANIIAIATRGNAEIKKFVKEVIYIPPIKDIFSPLLTVLPLQLLAYYTADLKGFDVDKPRNLAKSVTVE